jgi:hypothetical protein
MDIDDYAEVENGDGVNGISETRKPFYLLNALSDLLMIPKDVLMETTSRKEVWADFIQQNMDHELSVWTIYLSAQFEVISW